MLAPARKDDNLVAAGAADKLIRLPPADFLPACLLGFLRFEEGVQEIFAVQVLPGVRFPEMLEWNDDRLKHSYVLPDAALRDVPEALRE